jgi:hypothetical protein
MAFGDESSRLRVNTSSLSGEMRSAGFVEDDAMVIFIMGVVAASATFLVWRMLREFGILEN